MTAFRVDPNMSEPTCQRKRVTSCLSGVGVHGLDGFDRAGNPVRATGGAAPDGCQRRSCP